MISDVNDNTPYFIQDLSTGAHFIKVWKSDFSRGKPIMVVTAVDLDSGLNGQINTPISLTLSSGLSLSLSDSGVLSTVKSNPPIQNLTATLTATDKGTPPRTATATLTLEIVEDGTTQGKVKFERQDIPVSILENTPNKTIGALSGHVTSNLTGTTVVFDKVSGAENVKIDTSGNIKVENPFDREKIPSIEIVVRATVDDETDFALVTVTVGDLNDNSPTFGSTDKYRIILLENMETNTVIRNVIATDQDEGLNQKITYTIVPGSNGCASHFAVDPTHGVLKLDKNLDREGPFDYCQFSIQAADGGSPSPRTTLIPVEVTVQDFNDNSPLISDLSSTGRYDITTQEDMRISDQTESFGSITDDDIAENGAIKVYVTPNSTCPFTAKLDITTGNKIIFTLTSELDFETVKFHTCEVLVFDEGTPSLTSTVQVNVTVLDVNDNAPVFTTNRYAVKVSRDASIGYTVIDDIGATDVESDVHFKLADDIDYNGYFSIKFLTASITVNSKLVALQRDEVILYVVAIDDGIPPLSATATVNITIIDDNIRPVFDNPVVALKLIEHYSVVNPIFTAIATDRVGRQAPQPCQLCTYRLKTVSDIFEINNNTNGKISVKAGTDIDREQTAEVTLYVIATDPGNKDSIPLSLTITVLDINDHSPVFTDIRDGDYRFSLSQVAPAGSAVGTVLAEDADAGENAIPIYYLRNVRYSWSPLMNNLTELIPGMPFSISARNGTITTNASLDINATRNFYVQLVVRAEDSMDSLKVTDTRVTVQVNYQDPNRHHPEFSSDIYRTSLAKTTNIGTDLDINVTATDLDLGTDGVVTYSIIAGNVRDLFSINAMTGALSVAFVIDITADLVNLTIEAEDGGVIPKQGYCSVEIFFTGDVIDCKTGTSTTPVATDRWLGPMIGLAVILAICFTTLLVLVFYFIKLRHRYENNPNQLTSYDGRRKKSIYTAHLDRSIVKERTYDPFSASTTPNFPGYTSPRGTHRSLEGSVNGASVNRNNDDLYRHRIGNSMPSSDAGSSSVSSSSYVAPNEPTYDQRVVSRREPKPHKVSNQYVSAPSGVTFREPDNRSFRRSTFHEPTVDYE